MVVSKNSFVIKSKKEMKRWTEMKANRRAAKYFGKYFGVNWDYLNKDNPLFWKFPLYYP